MNLVRSCAFLFLAAALLLVQACSSIPKPAADETSGWLARYEERSRLIAALDAWTLNGRLAVSDSNDGGSGRLRWNTGPDGFQLDFHGALGRGAWRLRSGVGGAVLELANGEQYHADSVEDLVSEQLGWTIPAVSLSWWVRGVQAPGDYQARVPGQDGTLSELEQDGWAIEFGRYGEVGGILLPLKLTARQQDRTVKLAIRDWTAGNGDG